MEDFVWTTICGWCIGIVLGIASVVFLQLDIPNTHQKKQAEACEVLLDKIYQDNQTYWEDVLVETDEFQEYLKCIKP